MSTGTYPRNYGRYVLDERIAMGGMAEIFRARMRTEGFEKKVCIKRILPHFLEDEEFVTMFRDEARTAAKLQHANVVQVFDFGEEEGMLYLAMELVEGKDLRRILEQARKSRLYFEIGEAVQIAIDVCRGLFHAHTLQDEAGKPLGIVHRDISPHNVLVSKAGEVKVTDFGIARAAERATHTTTGIVKGKVSYMSPEQAQGFAFDHRLDQFALGVVLWEMLVGTKLFQGENDVQILKQVIACDPPRPSSMRRDVPAALDDIVLRSLALDPDKRYPDMRQFELALQRFLFSGAIDPETAEVRNVFPRIMNIELSKPIKKTNVISKDAISKDPIGKDVGLSKDAVSIDINSLPGLDVTESDKNISKLVMPAEEKGRSDVSMVFTSSGKSLKAPSAEKAPSGPAKAAPGVALTDVDPHGASSRTDEELRESVHDAPTQPPQPVPPTDSKVPVDGKSPSGKSNKAPAASLPPLQTAKHDAPTISPESPQSPGLAESAAHPEEAPPTMQLVDDEHKDGTGPTRTNVPAASSAKQGASVEKLSGPVDMSSPPVASSRMPLVAAGLSGTAVLGVAVIAVAFVMNRSPKIERVDPPPTETPAPVAAAATTSPTHPVPPATPDPPPQATPGDAPEEKPVDVKPVEAKPAEAKPVQTKPVEAKALDAKPLESPPKVAKGKKIEVRIKLAPAAVDGKDGWVKLVSGGEEIVVATDYFTDVVLPVGRQTLKFMKPGSPTPRTADVNVEPGKPVIIRALK